MRTVAFAKPPKYQTKILNNSFGDGVNTFLSPFEIKDSELTDMRNMNGDFYPALTVRPARAVYSSSLTSPHAIGNRSNVLLYAVDGINLEEWNTGTSNYVIRAASTTGDLGLSKIFEFNQPDVKNTITCSTVAAYYWDGSVSAIIPDFPKTRFACSYRDRVYALIDRKIQHSANRDHTDWTDIDEAGYVTIANQMGVVSGICAYADTVLAFTDQSIHALYGTQPEDYQLVDVTLETGAVEERTIKECRGVLYFLDYKNVYRYTGGKPSAIGDMIKTYIDRINWTYKHTIAAGAIGDKYFLSVPLDTATVPNALLEYNTKIGKWFVHTGNFIDFTPIQDNLYGLTSTGGVYTMESTKAQDPDGAIAWYMITKPFWDNSVEFKKALHSMWTVYNIASGGILRLEYSTNVDDTTFNTLASSTNAVPDFTLDSTHHNDRILVPLTRLQNVDWYRLKMSGEGLGKIFYVQRNIRIRGR